MDKNGKAEHGGRTGWIWIWIMDNGLLWIDVVSGHLLGAPWEGEVRLVPPSGAGAGGQSWGAAKGGKLGNTTSLGKGSKHLAADCSGRGLIG